MPDVTRMRLVGGNLALDFTNSRSGPPHGPAEDDASGPEGAGDTGDTDDTLTHYADLVSWAEYTGDLTEPDAQRLRRLAAADPSAAHATFERALRIRDDLDAAFRSLAHGRRPDVAVLARLRDDESDALRHARLDPGAGWSWRDDRTLTRPLWPAVHSAVDLLLTGPLQRVKQCGGCSFLFVDESKNRSRRWCSMDDCGTDEKVRRYVAARRAASTRP